MCFCCALPETEKSCCCITSQEGKTFFDTAEKSFSSAFRNTKEAWLYHHPTHQAISF